jgi:3-hydroxyacyl-CoA dehydrogenase
MKTIKRVGILGAGVMGLGTCICFAIYGYDVSLWG